MIREAGQAPAPGPHQHPAELTALFEAEYPGMVGMATILLGDRAAAEDVVQEGFARVVARWPRLRGGTSPGGYLRTTVVNLVRSRGRRATVATRHAHSAPPAHAAGPEDQAVAGDEHARVMGALAGLPDRQRECAVLRYYLEYSEPEIAEALGLAVGSVKSHLHRARQGLSRALEER